MCTLWSSPNRPSSRSGHCFKPYQNKFFFKHKIIPTKRLLRPGWNKNDYQSTTATLDSGDKYITCKKDSRTFVFTKAKNYQSLALVTGFHYAFANFNIDEEHLKETYNATILANESSVISFIATKRAEVGVVSTEILNYFKVTRYSLYKKLKISENYDQKHRCSYLVHKNSPISLKGFKKLLARPDIDKDTDKLLKKYGVFSLKPLS